MTLVNDNPTILEECQLSMHVDRVENMLCDSYIVEFSYDPTCKYYERGKYGRKNFHDNKLPHSNYMWDHKQIQQNSYHKTYYQHDPHACKVDTLPK